jgi:hypothetical protein
MAPNKNWTRILQALGLFLYLSGMLLPDGAYGLGTERWQVRGFLENNLVLRDSSGFQNGFMDDLEFVQWRTTFKLETDLGIRQGLRLSRGLEFRIERMFAAFRAAYDAIYDLREFPIDNEFRTGDFELGRNDLKLDADLRELYLDMSLSRFWTRIGRQIVNWGETDGFRILEIVNPLDTSFNLFFILPEENRIPLWMGRFIFTLPDLKSFTNTDLEFLVIPDIRPTLQAPPGAPYAIPIPLEMPTIGGLEIQLATHEDVPSSNFENSELGFRLTSLFKRFNFSLAYFYGIQDNPSPRLASVDILFGAGTSIVSDDWTQLGLEEIIRAIQQVETDLEVTVNMDLIHPYLHTAGFSYNVFEDYTAGTFRGEFTYTWDMAVLDLRAPDLVGRVDRIDWSLGFDRNTWIHALNKSTTFLFSLQLIGRHYQEAVPNEGELLGFPVTLNLIRRDSYLATLTVRTTYHHGLIIPTLFLGLDFDGLLLSNFMLQYLVNNYLSFTLGINSTWGNEVNDIERDPFLEISEISLKTVLQF